MALQISVTKLYFIYLRNQSLYLSFQIVEFMEEQKISYDSFVTIHKLCL